jgi:ElaA protein
MELLMRSLESLESLELYKIVKLRNDVFVVEQKCPYEEFDNKDIEAMHIYLKDDDKIVAYLRVLPPGVSYKEASIGRVLVSKKYRGNGYGRRIMKKGMDYCKTHYPGNIKISAQTYLKEFYKSLGFKKISDVYLEDNIAHIDMIYNDQEMEF